MIATRRKLILIMLSQCNLWLKRWIIVTHQAKCTWFKGNTSCLYTKARYRNLCWIAPTTVLSLSLRIRCKVVRSLFWTTSRLSHVSLQSRIQKLMHVSGIHSLRHQCCTCFCRIRHASSIMYCTQSIHVLRTDLITLSWAVVPLFRRQKKIWVRLAGN